MALGVHQPPQPHQQPQAQQASREPTLPTPVILTTRSFGAQAEEMCKRLVAHSCAGAYTHTHAPLHDRLCFDALSLLQPEGSEVCFLPPAARGLPLTGRFWLERSQPRDFC